MSDLFHEDIPLDYIRRVFAVMVEAHWHSFQVLTKRSKRLTAICNELPWPPNVWMGVSIEYPQWIFGLVSKITENGPDDEEQEMKPEVKPPPAEAVTPSVAALVGDPSGVPNH